MNLIRVGLVWCDNDGAIAITDHDYTAFIHTYEHDEELRGTESEPHALDVPTAEEREEQAAAEDLQVAIDAARLAAQAATRAAQQAQLAAVNALAVLTLLEAQQKGGE